MAIRIHFISGLPRSGSTLLAALLRQNPRFYARMSGPLADMYAGVMKMMSASESTAMLSDSDRMRILQSLVEAHYANVRAMTIFDTNRAWCNLLPSISQLFPDARVICCLRSPAWILDSLERWVQNHPFQMPKLFPFEPWMSVYNRVDVLTAPNGLFSRPSKRCPTSV